ncbi:MAG: ABC transporter permease [Mucilaginibacter polytrichastri]|nr:ABC transporter permease [Mucilaginibacter polytrichastri]
MLFRANIRTAFRYLFSHRFFSAINLVGMASGLCVCYFAMRYVAFELSYDTFNTKADQIYRLVTDVHTPAGIAHESSSAPVAPALLTEFPEVKQAVRVLLDNLILQKDKETYSDELIAYADPSVFSVFSFPLIAGDQATMLKAPFSMVLSETAAMRYFGTTDCIGKTLRVDGKIPARITGVMKDIPQNSHFRVDILFSMSTLLEDFNPSRNDNWSVFGTYTYLLLPEQANAKALERKLQPWIRKHAENDKGETYTLLLEPLKKVYLRALARGWRTGSTATGSLQNVYIFSCVAIFVLFIACFNFINMSTAFSLYRTREIGVRKVLGATRRQLIVQFLTDALVLSVLAFILAAALCEVYVPFFNRLCGKPVSPHIFDQPLWLGVLFLIALAAGLLAGIYPAFFLSGFQVTKSLKGRFSQNAGGAAFRKTLVVAQFCISVVLIVSTIVVYRQLHFMQNQDLGFDKDHKLVIDYHYDNRIIGNRDLIKARLKEIPGVSAVSMSSCIPGKNNRKFNTQMENATGAMQDAHSDVFFVDFDFLEQYGVKLKAGRMLDPWLASDSTEAMLVNETAVKSLGYPSDEAALGKRFRIGKKEGRITGVVADFHFRSYEEKITPLSLTVSPWFTTFLTVDISGDPQRVIADIEKTYVKTAPDLPMIWFFADETYDAQYRGEQRFGRLFICFSGLAILISCLGLLGLTVFSTVQRTKEIGIRKVLGASVASVVSLLTRDFIRLVLIAFVIAIPLSWLAMHYWLETFAYRIVIRWWMFALAGTAAVLIAALVLGFHTLRAAMTNPVKSLKSE